jgi:hypothetical protein
MNHYMSILVFTFGFCALFGGAVYTGYLAMRGFGPIYMLPYKVGRTRYEDNESWDDRDRRVLLTFRIPSIVGGTIACLLLFSGAMWWLNNAGGFA